MDTEKFDADPSGVSPDENLPVETPEGHIAALTAANARRALPRLQLLA